MLLPLLFIGFFLRFYPGCQVGFLPDFPNGRIHLGLAALPVLRIQQSRHREDYGMKIRKRGFEMRKNNAAGCQNARIPFSAANLLNCAACSCII